MVVVVVVVLTVVVVVAGLDRPTGRADGPTDRLATCSLFLHLLLLLLQVSGHRVPQRMRPHAVVLLRQLHAAPATAVHEVVNEQDCVSLSRSLARSLPLSLSLALPSLSPLPLLSLLMMPSLLLPPLRVRAGFTSLRAWLALTRAACEY